jgi:hypothetical protein
MIGNIADSDGVSKPWLYFFLKQAKNQHSGKHVENPAFSGLFEKLTHYTSSFWH